MLEADPLMLEFVLVMFVALIVLFLFYWMRQPSVVAYIAAGVVVGPYGLSLVSDTHMIEALGHFGVILLLFFIGMQVSLESLMKNWRVVVVGTLLQIAASVFIVSVLGWLLEWPFERSLLIGFVISLSSTAVILRLLETRGIIDSRLGKDMIGVLVAQDLLVIPMLITVSAIGGTFSPSTLMVQLLGVALLAALFFVTRKMTIRMPRRLERLATDSDYKLFASFVLCFGVALLTGLFHLSLGMGAFVGGMMMTHIKNIQWIREQLSSFKTLFVALFFMSVGLLINVPVVWNSIVPILVIVMVVFVVNTFINASIFHGIGRPWRYSLYAGAMLAQIGEFSFFLASVGFQFGAIDAGGYQLAIAVIALSLVIGPLWVKLFQRFEMAEVR